MISHNDPIAPIIFGVTLILVAALIGRFVARFSISLRCWAN